MMKTKIVSLRDLKIDKELIKIRPPNAVFVSRYRQAYRSGAIFPRIIVDEKSYTISSGNHRREALEQEYGPDKKVEVELRKYANRQEFLEDFVRENSSHGNALSGHSRRLLSEALIKERSTPQEVAAIFNVPIKVIEKWAGMTVVVMGKKGEQTTEVMKGGPEISGSVTREQKDISDKKDRALPFKTQAEQITRWLKNDWVRPTKSNLTAARELKKPLDIFSKRKMQP